MRRSYRLQCPSPHAGFSGAGKRKSPDRPDGPAALRTDAGQTALLDAYDDLADDAEEDFSYRKFVYGFRLGAALALEIVQGREKLLQT